MKKLTEEKQKELNEQLCRAISTGDLREVKSAIRAGADVNCINELGASPLMIAANLTFEPVGRKYPEGVTQTEEDRKAEERDLMIQRKKMQSKLPIMKYLVKKGADVNFVSKDGYTSLMIASLEGTIDAVKLLLGKNADINVVDKDEKSALYYAVKSGSLEVIKLCVDMGAEAENVIKKIEQEIYWAKNGFDMNGNKVSGPTVDIDCTTLPDSLNYLKDVVELKQINQELAGLDNPQPAKEPKDQGMVR